MNRSSVIVDQNRHSTVYIMVDIKSASEILPFLFEDEIVADFKDIRELLKSNLRNKEKYKKIDISDKAKDVYEMRFRRYGRNDRIFCKEFSLNSKRIIVMIELQRFKKTEEISKRYKGRIETIGGYEYEKLFT